MNIEEKMSGTLYIVALPLGNDADISQRAKDILQNVACIFAEDTRRAGLLFSRIGIKRAEDCFFVSCFEHNEQERIHLALDYLSQGKDIAYISDAGTPLIADPGYLLVKKCREENYTVKPVPGACAPIVALSASGISPYPFIFFGFLPRKKGQITELFSRFAAQNITMVFFERKNRLYEHLHLLYEVLGNREYCIARELTKEYEEFIYGKLGELDEIDASAKELLGEITVIIAPLTEQEQTSEADILKRIKEELKTGDKPKSIAKKIAGGVVGWSAKEIYAKIEK